MTYRHWPIAILQDRYTGAYSEGEWIAVGDADEHQDFMQMFLDGDGPWGDDGTAMVFWDELGEKPWLAVGHTPGEALAALEAKP